MRNAANFFTYCFLLACSVMLFSCSGKSKQADKPKGKQDQPTIVDVIIAEREPVSDVVEANGTVIPTEFLEIHPEVSGRLTYLSIAEGRPVAQGTVLARINDADLRAQVAKSKVQLDLAEKTVSRYKILLDAGGLNQSDYDLAVNQVNGYRADIAYTQALIDKTIIRAPFPGIIGLRQVSPGAYVTPATVLATLQQTAQVKMDFTLPDFYSELIKIGDLVDVELGTAGTKSHARIIAVEPGANTDTRNIKVRTLLNGNNITPGGFVKVLVNAGKGRSSIQVPTNAVIPDDRNNQVIVVKDGKANFVNVKTGIRQTNMVEVTDGLAVGDSIVVTGVLFARPKSKLKVRSVKKLHELAPAADSTSKH
ncbi:MAG: efflux RND transporter periplasmic adaptor subunit [Bacteroidetes bacterium]|nr:efflux RND transporter periplasmic adaptor subunit [Bacteroidota bacterium]